MCWKREKRLVGRVTLHFQGSDGNVSKCLESIHMFLMKSNIALRILVHYHSAAPQFGGPL
jgi:hypothetical protein